ncbi:MULTISPECIES: hypothetical protein [unclassified Dolichospermum]|uniref:hypothetical protein n=2 Tax=Cyanophyceae TaxID=3028117 RepID=UPI001446E969|nr:MULTISPECIES: hypothetical protein [unclassified Dolichospermum]MTJ18808.1 hypothetical protein [Dolichospermum sp. UHCC 0299]MTJ40559.1 hypothetical protein [Dolichospermum sp. UHCC 0406]
MCNDLFRKSECQEFCDSRKTIVVRDSGNKQEYRVTNNNGKEICKIKVDGCLIKESERCDYLILSCEDKSAFFVELKGHDLQKALSQIDSSINKLMTEIKEFKIYARIVLNRNPTPDINSSIEIKLKKRLKQQNGKDSGDLIKYKSQVLEENQIPDFFKKSGI